MKKVFLFLIILKAINSYSQNAELENKANNSIPERNIELGLGDYLLSGDELCGLIPIKDGKVYYEEIVESSFNAEYLYLNAKTWVVKSFVNAQKVIQLDDPINNRLMIKANLPISKDGQCFYFVLTIDTKDNKYRYQISNFEMQGFRALMKIFREPFEKYFSNYDCNKKSNQKELNIIKRNTEVALIESLKSGMNTPLKEKIDKW